MDIFTRPNGTKVVEVSCKKDVLALRDLDFDHLLVDATAAFDASSLVGIGDRIKSVRISGGCFNWNVLDGLDELRWLDVIDAFNVKIDLGAFSKLTDFRGDLRNGVINFSGSNIHALKIYGLKNYDLISPLKKVRAVMICNSPKLESVASETLEVLSIYNAGNLRTVDCSEILMFDSERCKSFCNLIAPKTILFKVLISPYFNIENVSLSPDLVSVWLAQVAPLQNMDWLYRLNCLEELIFDDKKVDLGSAFLNYINSSSLKKLRVFQSIGKKINKEPDDWNFLWKISNRIKEICELYLRCRT